MAIEMIKASAFYGVVFLGVGAFFGFPLFLALDRKGWFEHPWAWKKPVVVFWGCLFILGSGLGWGYGGAWYGPVGVLEGKIGKERFLEKTFARAYCDTCLLVAGVEATGKETPEEVEALLLASKKLKASATADLCRDIQDRLPALGIGTGTLLFPWVVQPTLRFTSSRFDGFDPVSLFAICWNNLNDNGPARDSARSALLMAFATQFQDIKDFVLGALRMFFIQNLFAGVVAGMGGPFLLLLLFRFVVRLAVS